MTRKAITVYVDDKLIWQLDRFAEQIGKSRSFVIEQLVQLASWESLVEAVEEGEVR